MELTDGRADSDGDDRDGGTSCCRGCTALIVAITEIASALDAVEAWNGQWENEAFQRALRLAQTAAGNKGLDGVHPRDAREEA